jgi:carbon storage regulator
MLVLSRKSGETVILGDEIRVTVLEIRGNSVKLGFVAPRELPIRREELSLESAPSCLPLAAATDGAKAPSPIIKAMCG